MADTGKSKKGSKSASLSAARRMLKEYQQNQPKKSEKNVNQKENIEPQQLATDQRQYSNENNTPIDSLASSTTSLNIQEIPLQEQQNLQSNSPTPQNIQNPNIQTNTNNTNTNNAQNYFNTALFQSGENQNHILTNYFDNIPKVEENAINFYQNNDNFGSEVPQMVHEAVNFTYASYDNQNNQLEGQNQNHLIHGQNTPIKMPVQNFAMPNNPNNLEQAQNELPVQKEHEAQNETQKVENNLVQVQNEENLAQSEFMGPELTFGHFDIHNPIALLKSESAFVENHTDISLPVYSNTESLRQLSSQLNSLLDTENIQTSTDNVLETRNQELAALLDQERQRNDQLNLQIREYTNRITQLETENQQVKNEYEARLSKEMGPLQEQLQYHVQTFGILVGEKTELSTALNQSQVTVKQKTAECEELQSRLRASRHRVSELEKEINSLKALKENINRSELETNREIERLKLEYGMLKDQFNEVSEEANEVKEKLNMKITEIQTLQGELQEKNSQLSLAQLRIQQLTVGENVQAESQLEILNQQKISLEQQVTDLTQTIKLVSTERDQASQQYQQYVQQLNNQLQNFSDQLQIKTKENENLSLREQSLVKHISELEKHLQQLQTEKQNLLPPPDNSATIKSLEDNIAQLEQKVAEITLKYDEELSKREKLEKEIEEKNLVMGDLEFKVEQMMSDRPDTGKLLAAMESDKVAASRATEQNQKLKNQLAELQDGFVLMSNSKLELTEKLEAELHRSKDVSERLAQKEADFEKLHNLITYKDKEILDLENQKTELNKQILQQTQQLDRLRHYEANGNVMELLQKELEESNKNLEMMVAENAELTKLITELQNKENVQEKVVAETRDNSQNTEVSVDNVDNTSVPKENENELSQSIRKKIESLENTNAELERQIKVMSSEPEYEIKHAQYLDKEKAMQQLEERFTKTMAEVAELTEEKQRLEHLVLQLQSETETIGEYVTLYQCQRAILKQKTLEKDEQLERLNKDRDAMKLKLDELNNLIKKLVIEKGDIPEEILNNKLLNSINYCEAHKGEEKSGTEIVNGEIENNNLGTAGQIIALLSEIKTSNLIQPNPDNIQNFHPCPCCSGKLLTV